MFSYSNTKLSVHEAYYQNTLLLNPGESTGESHNLSVPYVLKAQPVFFLSSAAHQSLVNFRVG